MANQKTTKPKLNAQRKLFVAEYLKDLNATQAAIRAGYSARTASSQGERLLRNVELKKAVDEGKAKQLKRVEVDADWMLKRLQDEAEADIADLYDEHDNIKPVREWPKIWRQGLVGGMDVEKLFEGRGEDREYIGNLVKLKLSDRVQRLKMLGDHIKVGAFSKKIELGGSLEITDMSETERAARIAALLAKATKS